MAELDKSWVEKQLQKATTTARGAQEHSNLNRNFIYIIITIMLGSIFMLFFSLSAMYFNYLAEKTSTYLQLVETVNENAHKSDKLSEQINELQIIYNKCEQ